MLGWDAQERGRMQVKMVISDLFLLLWDISEQRMDHPSLNI